MLKKIAVLLLAFACTVTQSWARIVETKNVSDILSEIDENTLVLFDIDLTTLTPTTTLGSNAWWNHFRGKVRSTNLPKEQTLLLIGPIVHKMLRKVPHKTVEPEVVALIHSLQERGITVWALTGRYKKAPWDPQFAELTRDQLAACGIDFELSIPPKGVEIMQLHPSYAYGILFTDGQQKGPVLWEFLQALNHRPLKVVMIDDLLNYLTSIENALKKENIPFVGFHYTRLAHLDGQFDRMIGNIQMHAL